MTEHLTEMDVRDVPFWRRLGAILQAFDQLAPGEVLELVVDIDPWPLHAHLDATRPGTCDWEPVASGPQTWRVRLRRRP